MAKDENARLLDAAGRFREYLLSQANLKGPISEALSASARDLKAGRPVGEAVGRFLEALKRAMEGGSSRGEETPGGRGVDQGKSEGARPDVAPSPGDDLLAAMGAGATAKPAPTTRPGTEIITPSEDKLLGANAAGEKIYERKDGTRYRMRMDRKDRPYGFPDFGGILITTEEAKTDGQTGGDDLLAAMGAKPAKSPEPTQCDIEQAAAKATEAVGRERWRGRSG